MKKPTDIDAYIAGFTPETQVVLEQLRTTILKASPKAEETISYAIPAFKLNGRMLVYFAGYKNHVSVYPVPNGDAALQKEIIAYRTGKGTMQFPLDKKLPLAFITRVVKQHVKENVARARNRKKQ